MDAAALKRDTRVISLLGLGHGFSHFFQLALPPLFPLMHDVEGFSFAQLGALPSTMYLVSAICQPPAGFLVDRFGARVMLLAGLALMSLATVFYGLAPNYEVMLVAAALVGLGNSVFHPCDYSVMNATISEQRMGRAYSLHMFGGYIGYGLAPVLIAWAGTVIGWHGAVIGAGLLGFVGLAIIAAGSGDYRDSRHERRELAVRAESLSDSLSVLFRLPILMCWLFFFVVAMGQIGLQTETASMLSLESTYGMDLTTAGFLVTVMLFSVPAGVLIGGYIADHTTRHDLVIGTAYGIAGALVFQMWLFHVPQAAITGIYLVGGLAYGIAFPSRELVVRSTTPKGASGKVFGFVYSGMDFGSFAIPAIIGTMIDHGLPLMGYLLVTLFWWAGIVLIKLTSMSTARERPAAA